MAVALLLLFLACAAVDEHSGTVEPDADCAPADENVHPGAVEWCDGVDNDCDGVVDEVAADALPWHADADGDGFGEAGPSRWSCTPPEGYTADDTDCNDADAAVYPGAPEPDCADPVDHNCDGAVGFADGDADGWAACLDCNDTDAAVNPEAPEACNGVDDDCNGLVDEADPAVVDAIPWYADADVDGYGDPGASTLACEAPSGFVAEGTDCNDADAAVNPAATELCNGVDDDCDDLLDDADPDLADPATWYTDADSDGFGDPAVPTSGCAAPLGTAADNTDCNDADPAVNPDATELCNAVDDDCDGLTDDADPGLADPATWYTDADSDGYGDPAAPTAACEAPAGTLADATDCNDADPAVNPVATELCNAVDDDCDGLIDDADPGLADPATWYADADSDGYGDPAAPTAACEAPAGTLADATDCNDADPAVNPAATELCNAADDDCNGLTDDADPGLADPATWYADADTDGFGDPATSATACAAPTGYLADATDCDDADATSHPGALDTCADGVDEDCDGSDALCFAPGDYSEADAFAVIRHTTAGVGFSGAITALGDTNGDGVDDLLLLDAEASDTASRQGAGYLFHGPLSGTYTPADADAVLLGEAASDALDVTTRPGDVDGDGLADVLLGGAHASPLGYSNEGGVWLFYGPLSGSTTMASADAEIAGGSDRRYLRVADGLGDVNGDGNDDLAVASWAYGAATADRAGVFHGPLSGDLTLDDADILVQGEDDTDGLGELDGGEDLDGDGIVDFVAGAPFDDTTAFAGGAAYVVLGPLASGTIDTLYDYRYTGDATNEWFGITVQLVPDLDGDGYAELVAGSYFEKTAAVVYGGGLPASGRISTRSDALITATSSAIADRNGQPRAAGDLDGDGDDELAVSDPTRDSTGTDEGMVGIFEAPLGTLTVLDAEVRVIGATDSDKLSRATAAGDMDDDGLADLLFSLPGDDGGAADAGAVWVLAPR